MKFTMTLTGASDIAKRLDELPFAVTKSVLVAALKAAAEPIRDRAQQNAPRSNSPWGHLKDHIVIQSVTRIGSVQGGRWQDSGGAPWIAVGPTKSFYYGIFPEYGTKHQGPQPFMRPAFDSGGPAALPILTEHLWAALRKKLPSSFPASTGFSQSVAA